jgi:hypothetical protein
LWYTDTAIFQNKGGHGNEKTHLLFRADNCVVLGVVRGYAVDGERGGSGRKHDQRGNEYNGNY